MFPEFSGSQSLLKPKNLHSDAKCQLHQIPYSKSLDTRRDQTRTFLFRIQEPALKKNEKNESCTKMFRIRHECEKSRVTNCSLSEVSTAKWLSYYRIERRNTMSCYHGTKISWSQQSFLTETAICIVERCKKNMDYCFVPECNHANESHESQSSPPYSGTRKLKGWFPLSRNLSVRTHVKFTRVN